MGMNCTSYHIWYYYPRCACAARVCARSPSPSLLIVAEKTSVRTFDGRGFCLSSSRNRSSIVAMPALDLVMVPEKYEPLCREDFRRQGILYIARENSRRRHDSLSVSLRWRTLSSAQNPSPSKPTGTDCKRMEKKFRTVTRIIGERKRANLVVRTRRRDLCHRTLSSVAELRMSPYVVGTSPTPRVTITRI